MQNFAPSLPGQPRLRGRTLPRISQVTGATRHRRRRVSDHVRGDQMDGAIPSDSCWCRVPLGFRLCLCSHLPLLSRSHSPCQQASVLVAWGTWPKRPLWFDAPYWKIIWVSEQRTKSRAAFGHSRSDAFAERLLGETALDIFPHSKINKTIQVLV